MAALALVFALLAFACMGLGMLLTVVPVVGAVLSFSAPALALSGIVLAGLALARSKPPQQSGGLAAVGLVANVLAFLPALLFAFTCGVCNACFSAGMLSPDGEWSWGIGNGPPGSSGQGAGAGSGASPGAPSPDPLDPSDAGQAGRDPSLYESVDGGPRPAFPPPPLGAAEGRTAAGEPAAGEPAAGEPAAQADPSAASPNKNNPGKNNPKRSNPGTANKATRSKPPPQPADAP